MRMGGRVSRAAPRPPHSPGRPGSMQAASGSGLPAPVQQAFVPKRKISLGARWQCVLAEGLPMLWAGVPLCVLAPLSSMPS